MAPSLPHEVLTNTFEEVVSSSFFPDPFTSPRFHSSSTIDELPLADISSCKSVCREWCRRASQSFAKFCLSIRSEAIGGLLEDLEEGEGSGRPGVWINLKWLDVRYAMEGTADAHGHGDLTALAVGQGSEDGYGDRDKKHDILDLFKLLRRFPKLIHLQLSTPPLAFARQGLLRTTPMWVPPTLVSLRTSANFRRAMDLCHRYSAVQCSIVASLGNLLMNPVSSSYRLAFEVSHPDPATRRMDTLLLAVLPGLQRLEVGFPWSTPVPPPHYPTLPVTQGLATQGGGGGGAPASDHTERGTTTDPSFRLRHLILDERVHRHGDYRQLLTSSHSTLESLALSSKTVRVEDWLTALPGPRILDRITRLQVPNTGGSSELISDCPNLRCLTIVNPKGLGIDYLGELRGRIEELTIFPTPPVKNDLIRNAILYSTEIKRGILFLKRLRLCYSPGEIPGSRLGEGWMESSPRLWFLKQFCEERGIDLMLEKRLYVEETDS